MGVVEKEIRTRVREVVCAAIAIHSTQDITKVTSDIVWQPTNVTFGTPGRARIFLALQKAWERG